MPIISIEVSISINVVDRADTPEAMEALIVGFMDEVKSRLGPLVGGMTGNIKFVYHYDGNPVEFQILGFGMNHDDMTRARLEMAAIENSVWLRN